MRKRLVRKIAMVAAVLAFAGLAAGARVLYTHNQVSAVATANAAPTLLVPPPPLDPIPQLKPVAPPSTTETTAARAGTIDIAAKVEAEDEAAAAPRTARRRRSAAQPRCRRTCSPARPHHQLVDTCPGAHQRRAGALRGPQMKLRVFFPTLALVALPHLALAADPPKTDPAAAQVLFYEARTLMQQNKFAEACPKLEESMRLDAGLGTQFNLADCNEHIGKITSAWAGFLEVAAGSKAANQLDREKVARKRAQALETRLPKLVVDVVGAPTGLEVMRDGIVVGPAAWGTPIPVDPGTHKLSATAPGKGTWETTVATTEGKIVHVSIPRDLPAAPVAVAPPAVIGPQLEPRRPRRPTATMATTVVTDFPAPVVEENGSVQRTIGWVVAGVGVVGVGLGAGFGLSSVGKRNESRSHCVVDQCDADGVGLRDDAIRNGNIATIAIIAGGAAIAGGLVLVLTAPKTTDSREGAGRLRAVPNVGLNGGGFTLQGNFQ